MRRILLVAPDRALTRFIAESLLEHSVDTPPKPDDPWDVARAHTPLEAQVLVAHGGRPFDVVVLDHDLGGEDALKLIAELRDALNNQELPIFLLTERGRDPHIRRIAVERHRVTGFIEKPVTAESLRSVLGGLERHRRILLAEADDDLAERYLEAFRKSGYVADRVANGRDALDRAPRFRPDIMVCSLVLPDLKGLELCVALKRAHRGGNLPVVLYGQVSALGHQASEENALRADDFVQAPFDDEVLIERIAHLVGIGPGRRLRPRRRSLIDRLPQPDLEADQPTLNDLQAAMQDDEITQSGAVDGLSVPHADNGPPTHDDEEVTDDTEPPGERTPPPSASPAAVSPTRRSTRRVPCHTAMSIRNGETIYRSRTLDISHGGIFLATDESLEIGERIDMAFKLPGSETTIRAVGKVCWVGRGGAELVDGVGVKFSRIAADDLTVIVEYVNRVARVLYSASQ